jgi:hypothetical protein
MYESIVKNSLRELAEKVQKEAWEWSWMDLSRVSDVSPGTCKNFTLGKTKSPHHRTVIKLARAIGISVVFEQTEEPAKPQLKIARGTRAARKTKKTRRLKKAS